MMIMMAMMMMMMMMKREKWQSKGENDGYDDDGGRPVCNDSHYS